MNMIQKGYERKDSKSKKTTQAWTSIEEFWDVFLWVAKDYAKTSPATLAYAPTSTDVLEMFNAWKTWKMADLKFVQVRYLPRLPCSLLPDDPRAALASESELAAGWVGAFWPTMDEEPVHKETTEITSSSHNTNHTNRIHPTHQAIAILHWWNDTAHHCCSVNMLSTAPSAVHVAGLQRYGRRGILKISMAMILLVWWIRWQ